MNIGFSNTQVSQGSIPNSMSGQNFTNCFHVFDTIPARCRLLTVEFKTYDTLVKLWYVKLKSTVKHIWMGTQRTRLYFIERRDILGVWRDPDWCKVGCRESDRHVCAVNSPTASSKFFGTFWLQKVFNLHIHEGPRRLLTIEPPKKDRGGNHNAA